MERLEPESPSEDACPSCRGYGWVRVKREGRDAVSACPVCSTDNRRDRLLEGAKIPRRYMSSGFDNYNAMDPTQALALAAARRFVDGYPAVKRGLLFAGPCGVGKTHLSVAILLEVIRNKLLPAVFIDEAELLRRLQYSYGPDAPETEREVMIPLMEVGLLVWDDLGTGRPTDWVAETIRTILNHRYTSNKPTILNTNWPVGEAEGSERTLQDRIGTRLYSRIMEMCRVIPIEGIDFRTQISKARHDSLDRRDRSGASKALGGKPVTGFDVAAMLGCPGCGYKKIRILEQRETGRGVSRFVDMQCQCRSCEKHFGAQFAMRTGRMTYVD